MNILYAIILGIIQGFTEFLPISSSGHLLLFERIFGISEGNLFFNILLHIASLLAVIIVMRKEVCEIIKKPFSEKSLKLSLSSVLTIIVVLFLSKSMNKFTTIGYLGFGFLISALLILFTYVKTKKRVLYKEKISYLDSCIIGISQGIASLPGISRSGTTICVSLLLGNNKKESASFSFLLSIPIIIGAMIFDIISGDFSNSVNIPAISCIFGFVSSFIVAFFSIKLMKKIIEKSNWLAFSIYLFIISIFALLNQYVFMWI